MLAAVKSLEFFPKMDRESLLLWCSRHATLAPHPFQPIPIGGQLQQEIGFMVFDSKPGADRANESKRALAVDVHIPLIPPETAIRCLWLSTVTLHAAKIRDEFDDFLTCLCDGYACRIAHAATGHAIRVDADVTLTVNESGDVGQLDIRGFAEFVIGLDDTSIPLVPFAGSGVMAGAAIDTSPTRATLERREIAERFGFFAVGASSLFRHSSKIAYMCGGCQ